MPALDQRDFKAQIKGINETWDTGFWRDIPILAGVWLEQGNSNSLITGSTTPQYAAFDTNDISIGWLAGNTDRINTSLIIPGDYDSDADALKIMAVARMDGSTDTPSLDAELYRRRAGTLSADLDPTKSAALSNTYAEVEIVASGLDLQGGDQLTLDLFPEAHATDQVHMAGVWLRFRSSLVLHGQTEANR